jgi:hypothetical protein
MARVELTLDKLFCGVVGAQGHSVLALDVLSPSQNGMPLCLAVAIYEKIIHEGLYRFFTDEKPFPSAKILHEGVEIFGGNCKVYTLALMGETPPRCEFSEPLQVYNFFTKLSNDTISLYWGCYHDEHILNYKCKYRHTKVHTGGNGLLALGFKEGRQIGCILQRLLEANLVEQMTPEQEIKWILSNFSMENS